MDFTEQSKKMNGIEVGAAAAAAAGNCCNRDTIDNGKEHSDLAKIDMKSEDGQPLDLFIEWHEEAKKLCTGQPDAVCLATVSEDRKVSARHLLIRHYDQRGFVIVTDNRSKKSKNLAEVPNAAMCVLWVYEKNHRKITRQVRMEGKIECLSPQDYRYLYEREPLFCKIRSHLCHQGKQVNWYEHKKRHDELYRDVTVGNIDLPMPDHFIGYRLIPETFEYYYAYDHLIADRIIFTREDGKWASKRIAA